MELIVLLAVALLGVLAIIASAIAAAAAGVVEYRLAERLSPEHRLALVLVVIGTGALLSVALTSRTLNEAQRVAMDFVTYDDYAKGFAASRWLSLLLIAASLIEIIRGWVTAHRRPVADKAAPLLLAVLAYYIGTLVIQGVASERTGISHKDLYLPIVLVAVYYQRIEQPGRVLDAAKWMLFALDAGSLLAMAWRPDFAVHAPEQGLIPGVEWRLYGLTEHANTLGPAALLAIVLACYRPASRRSLQVLQLAPAVVVLVLAQSRTAWAAGLGILVLVGVPLLLRGDGTPRSRHKGFERSVWTLLACMAAAGCVVVALLEFGLGEFIQKRIEVTTLNGRFLIWSLTLDGWRENPLFGYGPEIWGADRQLQFRMFHVGHAHNQVVQTLGEAGIAGLVLLVCLLGALLRAALRRFEETRGLALALLLVLVARCITEAPMRSEGLLTWASFLHVLIFSMACHGLRVERANEPKLPRVRDEPWVARYSIDPR